MISVNQRKLRSINCSNQYYRRNRESTKTKNKYYKNQFNDVVSVNARVKAPSEISANCHTYSKSYQNLSHWEDLAAFFFFFLRDLYGRLGIITNGTRCYAIAFAGDGGFNLRLTEVQNSLTLPVSVRKINHKVLLYLFVANGRYTEVWRTDGCITITSGF